MPNPEQRLRDAKSTIDIAWAIRDILYDFLHGTTGQAWLARLVVFLSLLAILAFVVKKMLELAADAVDAWKKAGLPVPFRSPLEKQLLQQRRRFCVTIASDLDQLNKAENWNDQQFTDLEADVETNGWYYASRLDRLIKRRSQGERRVPSLMAAIESSVNRRLIVVGDPGSGKSVALRHLARDFAERGKKSTEKGTRIPLYVNLRELPTAPEDGPSVDWIKKFVIENVRRGDADTAQYVRENWTAHIDRGLWLFLFDSFDEIPAVMHAAAGSPAVREHADAIRRFLDGTGNCTGIVASREFKGPQHLPWDKLRILPMSHEKQRAFVANWYLARERRTGVENHLVKASASIYQNPLFLALLCRHMREQTAAPPNDHDLLFQHLVRLAERDADRTSEKYGLSPVDLIQGATRLAVLFACNEKLGLAPTYDEIGAVMGSVDGFDILLDALVDVKLGRSDVRETRRGDKRFTFAHRRYQEVLFVRYLAAHRTEISPSELLLGHTWREYTVAFLQNEPFDDVSHLIETAVAIVDGWAETQVAEQRKIGYFEWREDKEVWLLSLLQEGLGRRTLDVSESLRTAISRLLLPRWAGRDIRDRVNVLKYGGLLPESDLIPVLSEAVRDGTAAQRSAAFRTIGYLQTIPDLLASWLLTRLSNEILSAPGNQEILSLEAEAARLPASVGARYVYRRCRALRKMIPPGLGRAFCGFDNTGWISASIMMFYGWGLQAWLFRGVKISVGVRAFVVSAAGRTSLLFTAFSLFGILSAASLVLYVVAVRDVGGNAASMRMWPALKRRPYLCVTLISTGTNLWAALASSVMSRLGMSVGLAVRGVVYGVAAIFANMFTVAVISFPVVAFAFVATRIFVRGRRRRRLREHLAKTVGRERAQGGVAMQARTLSELSVWLGYKYVGLCPDEMRSRELARLLLIGKEDPDRLPDSPLASYMRKMKGRVNVAAVLTRIEHNLP